MSTIIDDITRIGTRAAQPVVQVNRGTLYSVSDEANKIERWNGSAWVNFGPSGGGGGSPIKYEIETANTTDSDPTAGLLKFNHATQSSASEIYLDNVTYDAVSLTTFLASLPQSGFITLTQASDSTKWRVYKVLGVTAMSGYYKLSVVHQAGSASGFADAAQVFVSFDSQANTTAGSLPVDFPIAVGDEATAITTGTSKITFRMTRALNLTGIRASVTTAPTGATIIVDVNLNGVSIMSGVKLSIDAGEKSSVTAAVAAVLTTTFLPDDGEITIDIDQVGSTIAGAGLKVYLIGTAASIVVGGSGIVAQVVNFQTGAVATGAVPIPLDDTIPQNNEGTEFMSLSITPTSATNKLKIDVVAVMAPSTAAWLMGALFRDSGANAIAAAHIYQNLGPGTVVLTFTHFADAGSTATTTFKFRGGQEAAGTMTFNGYSGNRRMGGVMASSITITEIVPGALTASSGSTKYRKVFKPRDNEPPPSAFATLDTRNGHPVLDFDSNTQEAAIFSDVMPSSYNGGSLTVKAIAALTSATTGTLGWDVAIETDGTAQDIDSDSFAAAVTLAATTVPGTSGLFVEISATISGVSLDGLAPGNSYRIRIRRDVANDNAAGDAELWALVVIED